MKPGAVGGVGRRAALSAGAALSVAGLSGESAATELPLRERARRKGLLFGAAARSFNLRDDPAYAAAFARECGVLVTEWEAKWGPLRPTREEFSFGAVDALWQFARRHGLGFRGHALVWHEHMPRWIAGMENRAARGILEEHIRRVLARYPRAQSWDVVNEAIDLKDGRADGLRQTVWLRALGPTYVRDAFVLARAADPHTLLTYNDYGIEYEDRDSRAKRVAVLRLLESLRQQDAPVDVFGVQAHLNPARPFDPAALRGFLRGAAEMGFDIYITELDVHDRDLPADGARRDRIVADHAQAWLEAALSEPRVKAVFTWGLSDRYNWRNEVEWSRRRDGLPSRGLPLDQDLQPKPFWTAIARTLDGAEPRGR
ncbi:endo-1,4-beta-xylanase [Sabulicella glaciei]|uniref:Beta-xylanase n=1 Tax=Sabulicella glaciei TaxID=2984948 RepID=A0ABT3P0Z3_9PROT|nr:endo-1,4-beta-xylanase [Roseococcus sp. MDT2-1-1]